MPNLCGQTGELRFTIQVTRKDTGKTEEIELIGFLDEAVLKEIQNGGHALNSGAERGD